AWLAGLAGRLGREGIGADRVRAQHGLPRAAPRRRSHDARASLPARHRGDLVFVWESVIPGRLEETSPESRASGFGASHRPGMTGESRRRLADPPEMGEAEAGLILQPIAERAVDPDMGEPDHG